MNQLIRCINCDEVFMRTPFDQSPEYALAQSPFSGSLPSIERNDFEDFLKNHHGHQMENLKILEDSFVSGKAYLEPIKISYFKATNGKESFVIKKFREKIDEPLTYQLIHGDYSLECTGIEIEAETITKQFEREYQGKPLSPEKMAAFLKLCRHLAKIIDIKNMERIPEESPHPLEIYYKLDDLSIMYLLRNCHHIFGEQEYLEVEKFIQRHRENGVLLLKATYKIIISEEVKIEKRTAVSPIPSEMKKLVEKKD